MVTRYCFEISISGRNAPEQASISSAPRYRGDFILVDEGLTFPKIEAFHQRAARVKHVPQLIGHRFPGVFDDRVVDSVHVHAGDAYQLPQCQGSLIRDCAVRFFRFFEARHAAHQALPSGVTEIITLPFAALPNLIIPAFSNNR